MYEGNPGEIDFGSVQREVRVSGSQLVFGDNNFFELKLFPLTFKNTKIEFINE